MFGYLRKHVNYICLGAIAIAVASFSEMNIYTKILHKYSSCDMIKKMCKTGGHYNETFN